MLRSRNLTIALLLGVLIGMIAPAAGANPPLYLSPSTTSVQPSISNPQPVRVLSSAATGAAFEVAVSWDQLVLEPTTANGKTYVQVSLPGWASTSQAGAPSLPVLAKAVAAPQGATVTVRVTPGQAHTVALPAPPLPVASQVVEWAPPATGAAPVLPEPITVIEEDPAIYTGVAAYPAALAEVTSDGVMRQQRVLGIATYPVQYNPAAQQLIVYESLRVEVVFEETPTSEALKTTGHVAPGESAAYEDLMRGELLNYEAARAWRSDALTSVAATGETEATGVETTATGIDASPWTPPAPGWRVTVREEGFYKLTYTELQQAGLPVDTLAPATFKLFNLGREVAIHEQGDGDSQFEAGEYLLFYGQAINSKYTADNIYWLTYGGTAGLRMAARDGTPGDAVTPASYTAQRHLEGNAYYVSFMPGDDNLERWLWDYIYRPSRPSWTHTFTLAEPYAGPATLTVAMLGYLTATANPDHHAAITLNGTPVGDVTWDGIAWYVSQISVPAGILVAGTNTLAVTSVADTGYAYDVFYIDWVQLAFSNTFTAEDDALRFTIDTSGVWKYQVNGFSTDQVAAYDVTDPAAVSRIEGINVQGDGPYSVLFQDTVEVGGGPMSLLQETATAANYWAIADTAYQTIQAETDIEADIASSLQATTQGADHVIITHPDFLAQAAQLRDYRISQGLRAIVADIRDVYDEFGYGIEGAAPIHDFLAHTYASWQAPAPSYVVLLGDGHYDPKNYVYTRTSYIPPYLAAADPWIRETAADNRYVTVAGDDILPDMMLGRMSVNSAAEASAFVNKIIAYEASPAGDWQQRVLAVADNADSGGNFDLMSDDLLSAHLPDPYQAQKVYYGVTHTTTDGARTAIQDGINAGALIVNYIGHAYATAWAEEDLLKTSDVPLLQNAGKFPVMLGMDCREGYYHSPNPLADGQEALAEVITRAEGKGAVASWSPAGLGVATGHDHLDRGFFDAVFTDNLGTVGAGTTAGKLDLFATGSNLDLLDTFLLFGDPATQLPTACVVPPAVSLLYIALVFGPQVQLDWTAVPGALNYQVWWNADDPYFTPGAACTEANGCTWRSDTTFTHAGETGNTAVNNSYLVLPVSACGTGQGTPMRVGEFDFALVPGD